MSSLVTKLFGWQSMLKPDEIQGDIPTNKEVYQKTVNMAWPSALEMVMITLIGAVDTAMVGTIGKEAISAVGICTQPKFVILAPTMALNIGVTVLVARRKGEGNPKSAASYMNSAIAVSIILAIVLSVLGIIFARPFLQLAGAGEDYIDLAVTYFQIIELGNIFSAIDRKSVV